MLLIAILICITADPSRIFSRDEIETTVILPTEVSLAVIPTMPPVLESVEFPNETVEYPRSWTSDLIYPNQFSLVDTQNGFFIGSDSIGWEAKQIFDGDDEIASEILSAFFVERLDLSSLVLQRFIHADTGRPPYHPGDLLRLYIYGYLNRVRSSRLCSDCINQYESILMEKYLRSSKAV